MKFYMGLFLLKAATTGSIELMNAWLTVVAFLVNNEDQESTFNMFKQFLKTKSSGKIYPNRTFIAFSFRCKSFVEGLNFEYHLELL